MLAALSDPVDLLLGADLFSSHRLAIWLFLRSLGGIFLVAFLSLWGQLDGLYGRRGILPVRGFLDRISRSGAGSRALRVPSLFWLNASDATLHGACAAGVAASLLVVLGVAPAALLVLWLLYLSFASAGGAFLSYQWDVLLLEAGFLGIFLAPWEILPGGSGAPPGLALLLLWWLLFRLVFQSGLGKLSSGDATWRDLSALRYHWFTQPLPTPLAWYVSKLPEPAHRASTAATHVVEVGVPLLIFGPEEARWAAAGVLCVFQLLIMATGNYNFFNLLTVALCLLLIGDAGWHALLPQGVLEGLAAVGAPTASATPAAGIGAADPGPLRTGLTLLIAGLWLAGSVPRIWQTFRPNGRVPAPLTSLLEVLQPFRTINTYGLFRVMTRQRPEIIVEGSRDGESWEAYEFRWKPGDPSRPPGVAQPHQPRLDWQMWFAALGSYRTCPWFQQLQARLLEGSGPVLDLFEGVPFPAEDPPRYVRARLFRYRFTTWKERKRNGRWWSREEVGPYGPVLTRRDDGGTR